MAVTFLIGNGFDLHMGMKTRYIDVYEGYIESESKNYCIAKFKELLKEDAPNEFTNWADFEQKMGESTDKFSSEQDFVDCVRDFKEYLAKHLEIEEKNFLEKIEPINNKSISNEMKHSLTGFYKSLINRDRIFISSQIRGRQSYNFVNFNYTSTLSKLLSCIELNQSELNEMVITTPFYIHGKLDSGIVLGMDNEKQLNENCNYSFSLRIKRAFLKPFFNELFDPNKVNLVYDLIMRSSVICVYGLSFGQSDFKWVETIINWLKSSPSNQLVYFKYSNEEYNLWHKDLIMDVEDDYKDELLSRINYANHESINDLFDQVHIPVGFDIFNIKKIIIENEKSAEQFKNGKQKAEEALKKMANEKHTIIAN